MRSKYKTIKPSTQINSKGNPYPDMMSFPIEKFSFTGTSKEYFLTQTDIDRIDLLMFREYGSTYYDDLVLWLNDIDSLKNVSPGLKITLPSKRDLDRFIVKFMR